MISIEIADKSKWIADPLDRASISLNGTHTFDGKVKSDYGEFEITDLNGALVVLSKRAIISRWDEFLGRGGTIIRTPAGEELARISNGLLLGLRPAVTIHGNIVICRYGEDVKLPGASIHFAHPQRIVRVEISDESDAIAYMGIAFRLRL